MGAQLKNSENTGCASRMTPALAGRKRLRGSTRVQLWHHSASFRTCVDCTVCWEMVCFCCCWCPRRWALETHGSCRSTDTGTAIAPLEAHEAEVGCCIAPRKD